MPIATRTSSCLGGMSASPESPHDSDSQTHSQPARAGGFSTAVTFKRRNSETVEHARPERRVACGKLRRLEIQREDKARIQMGS